MQFTVDGERNPGLELVEELLSSGRSRSQALTPELAEQAIDAFESLESGWLASELVAGGENFAEQVHSIATRGLQEIVQNADDQNAHKIRFGFRRRGSNSELLVAHDGNPVEIVDVMRMAIPLLSGSRSDPEKIGRFGIGLKTLNQLGDRLAVHCPPVPGFEIKEGRIKRIRTPAAIRNFWDPKARETLFVLQLGRHQFDLSFFEEWLSTWDASSLLFLRSLKSVSLVDLSNRRGRPIRCAVEIGKPQTVALDLPKAPSAKKVTIRDTDSGRQWTKYMVDYPRPKWLKATNKQVGDTVLLQLAIPNRRERSRIYVGLPLEEPCALPYSVSAPFDPNVERTKLRDNNELNSWLIDRVGDLAAAISLRRFAERPRSGWCTVPLGDEGAGESSWTSERFSRMAARHRRVVLQRLRLTLPEGPDIRLQDLTYEPPEFDGLIDSADLNRLWEETSAEHRTRYAVPRSWRDSGRWRQLLKALDGPELLYATACVSMLDWPDSEIEKRGPKWLVDFAAAALSADLEDDLWSRRCVGLARDGGRISPESIDVHGTLLVHAMPSDGLAATLGLAHQISRALRAKTGTATGVRDWLNSRDVLRQRAKDADALRALAGAERQEPIDLRRRDSVLVRIRNAFDQLPLDLRESIGPALGNNLGIGGYACDESGKRVKVMVRIARAYLPSAIDKSPGWPTAAGQTPGLLWIDRGYSDILRSGSRGHGTLAFLRALGAATAPRLERGAAPTQNPNAPRLSRSKDLSTHHQDELSHLHEATSLRDDWTSPDLEAVVANLLAEKRTTIRQKRARSLFAAIDKSWNEQYAERSVAMAVHHRYSWHEDGEVSATWIARLASEPWLSTREDRYRAAAPRELSVLTDANFGIEGDDPRGYVREIDSDQVDSPLVEALGIQGQVFASTIVSRLEELRAAELRGEEIDHGAADRCYRALGTYAPGGDYAERSDMSDLDIRRAFARRPKKGGLIRTHAGWLAPAEVRSEPFIDPGLPWVSPKASHLWALLGVKAPTASDCVGVLRRQASDPNANRSGEILAFRRLLELRRQGQVSKKALKGLPLRLHSFGSHKQDRVFAVENLSLAHALGEKWPVWDPPVSMAELAPLVPLLDVHPLHPENFEDDIPSALAASSFDAQVDFVAAVGHLQDHLAKHHPSLHRRLAPESWTKLGEARVLIGSDWGIRVRADGRSARLQVRAHLFTDPLRFCVLHEDEIAAYESGGQAIADYFGPKGVKVADDTSAEDRSTLALAWAYAYDIRGQGREQLSVSAPTPAEDTPIPTRRLEALKRKGRLTPLKRMPRSNGTESRAEPRKLVDLTELSVDEIDATFLQGRRSTKMRFPEKTKLAGPRESSQTANDSSTANGRARSGHAEYTPRDREDVAYRIAEAFLEASNDLDLEDIRDRRREGADAVDRGKDIWVELKAHGRDLPENLRFPPAEALRAEEKRGRYYLVVLWDLEKPRTPKLVVVPDPLYRLDTYFASGIQLTGLQELAKKSSERIATLAGK
jgi:hypothetical protein